MTQVRSFSVNGAGSGQIAAGQIITGCKLSVEQRRSIMGAVIEVTFDAMEVSTPRERAVVLYRIADGLATGSVSVDALAIAPRQSLWSWIAAFVRRVVG
jgi:hypothetical protein